MEMDGNPYSVIDHIEHMLFYIQIAVSILTSPENKHFLHKY